MRTHSLADLPGALRDLADFLDRRGARKLDRLFWHRVRMARFGPDIHFPRSYEIDEPFRVARCVILHLEPFRTGLCIGWYSRTGIPEHEALLRAVSRRKPPQTDLDEFDEDILKKPGTAGGLRFSATYCSAVEQRGPQPGMVPAGNDGVGQ